tara:strand:- start:270 stop:692 length:423 start_codon:yes stop_codon:yes gene_type:complete
MASCHTYSIKIRTDELDLLNIPFVINAEGNDLFKDPIFGIILNEVTVDGIKIKAKEANVLFDEMDLSKFTSLTKAYIYRFNLRGFHFLNTAINDISINSIDEYLFKYYEIPESFNELVINYQCRVRSDDEYSIKIIVDKD